jgi:hypothetical protein
VGTAGISSADSYFQSLCLDALDNPVVAYRDNGIGSVTVVQRWTGSNWEIISGAGIPGGPANYQSLALTDAGDPVVAYEDISNASKTTVRHWDGSAWVAYGGPGISASTALFQSLTLDASGYPVVAYYDQAEFGRTTVKRWNGSEWNVVGTTGFTASVTSNSTRWLQIDDQGNIVLAYASGPLYAKRYAAALLSTNNITGPLCAGSDLIVTYSTSATYNAGNTFTTQLSDATGDFTNPVDIGTANATGSGTINCTIPLGTAAGSGYRIRVISDDPVNVGADNGTDLVINAPPANVSFSGLPADIICTTAKPIGLTGDPAGGLFSGPGVTGTLFDPATAGVGLHTVTYTYTNASGCSASVDQLAHVEICTGTMQPLDANALAVVFPNPVTEVMNIEWSNTAVRSHMITLADPFGRAVDVRRLMTGVGAKRSALDLSDLPSGLYLLNLIDGDANQVVRVVKN